MSDPTGPPGRQVVLLRAGPSKRKPLVVDGIVGGVGAILLVAAIFLVGALAEEEVLDPQYKVTFGSIQSNAAETGFTSTMVPFVAAGETLEWQVNVVNPNVVTFEVGFYIEEDLPATLPDFFRLELEAPNGTVYAPESNGGLLQSIPTIPNPAQAPAPQFYLSSEGGVSRIRFPLGLMPADYIFSTAPGFELFEVREAVRAEHFNEDALGTWTVRMTLEDAGGCPALDPTSSSFQRAQQCVAQNSAGGSQDPATDPGNGITFSVFEYNWYSLAVEAQ